MEKISLGIMLLNMTFTWCTWGHWIHSLQLQFLLLCFSGISEAVGNINLVCISLFEALMMLLMPYVQEWVCAESCSWDQGLPSSWGSVCAQEISKSRLKLLILPGPREFIHSIKCPQGEGSLQLSLGGMKHCRAHFVCTSFEILIKTQNSSLLDLTVPLS